MQIRLLALICGLSLLAGSARAADPGQPHHAQWEKAIASFEAADKTNPPPRGAVLFIGSSSIRLWTNAPAQFPEHQIVNRGFGGSHVEDAVAFVERIVTPYAPKLVLLYAGDNDLAAGKSPDRVCADFKAFVAKVRAGQPTVAIGFISIKPSPSRVRLLPQVREANRLLREFIAGNDRLAYVDVFAPMLDAAGKPRAELFVKDMLHLNADGYKLWAGIVKPVLDKYDAPPAR